MITKVEVVLDVNWEGAVIGLEIISLLGQTGPHALDGLEAITTEENLPLRWSFDPGCDAFYLRLRRERSVEQPLREAAVWLDQKGRIIRLEVDADDPAP